jgi:hypothetical protein
MKFHQTFLSRRLINETSADSEKEENMVEWLRVRIYVHDSLYRALLMCCVAIADIKSCNNEHSFLRDV